MATADNVDRSISQAFDARVDMILRTKRWIHLAIGIEGTHQRIAHVHIGNEDT